MRNSNFKRYTWKDYAVFTMIIAVALGVITGAIYLITQLF